MKKPANLKLLKASLIRQILALMILSVSSCHSGQNPSLKSPGTTNKKKVAQDPVRFAKGFSIHQLNGFRQLEVMNPWQGAEHVSFQYVLVDEGKKLPGNLPGNTIIIHTPVKRIVCTSTTHIALLEMIDELQSIVGVSGTGLITNQQIRQKIEKGTIRDIGYDRNLNYETLVSLKPDLVMMYGVESEMAGFIKKINELGIPVVMNGEYLEKDPLAKLEWVRFVASFFDKEELAQSRFDSVVVQYEKLKSMCDSIRVRPIVMTGLPWKDVWYVSAGNTNIANYIRDAGGTYIWHDLKSKKAVPMDIETVFAKSNSADFWINIGTVNTRDDLLNMDDRFIYFKPVKNNQLFNNNARLGKGGGNDYWEGGLTHPQDILSDLIAIFHPELLPDHQLIYYRKLPESDKKFLPN